jgi:hypothetical protein
MLVRFAQFLLLLDFTSRCKGGFTVVCFNYSSTVKHRKMLCQQLREGERSRRAGVVCMGLTQHNQRPTEQLIGTKVIPIWQQPMHSAVTIAQKQICECHHPCQSQSQLCT